mmetsp:Transcript_1812/g.3802  ORF Transcript_1812/g.3802 Transcript_1812/m.3802 type:complete len:199 (+) Transcript_1812:86-682(+)|eukprot:CAMPEP_0172587250 /NCGR_PEP_ID=MMETSP1068-20121228/6324_1 /TAXON_ID=35684 /ORGANISM="Pseudopedinella elastica, Strain CCMP716" /LENGTH=198 /DNA_ID=CAMNT_0013382199 /DNA_START=86 /DNA_END=682 /DNA_ORIENTATION=-
MSSKKKGKNKAKKEAAGQVQEAFSGPMPGEEIFYQAPDPNTKMTRPASLAGKIDDSKFMIIWPANINTLKTEKEGRRVPKASCCDDPIVSEMSEVLTYFKFVHVIEPFKRYPRDPAPGIGMPGRVKVQFKQENGEPCNPELPNRRALLKQMGELIPKLQIRQARLAKQQQQITALASHQAASQAVATTGAKKKGKGKR